MAWTGYDPAIERAWRNFVPEGSNGGRPDWKWFKAQLYQESGLDTYAKSGVGARGLCQAMPATFKDWARDLRWGDADPHVARYCIEGGAYYMAQLRRFPDWHRWSEPDRHRMAQAAYNAGAGNIRKALRIAATPNWPATAAALPAITGRINAKQTTDYVRLIAQWRARLGDAPPRAVIVCAWIGHRGGCGVAR